MVWVVVALFAQLEEPAPVESAPEVVPPADTLIVVEPETPPEPPVLESPVGRTWATLGLGGRLAIDGSFDDRREDVAEWWNVGRLKLDHRSGEALRLFAEARVRGGVVGRHTRPDDTFWVANAKNKRWTGEVELREGYASLIAGPFEITAGQRLYVWGKNELLAPADVVNPVDLRYDPLAIFASPRDGKVPVFTVDAAYASGDSALRLVVLPFFTPNQARLWGRDFAFAPPGSEREEQIRAVASIHPSVEDALQDAMLASELPEESPLGASAALRATTKLAGWDTAATVYYGWDRTPRVRIDQDLQILLANGQRILGNPQVLATDPGLRDASVSVQQKAAVGQELVTWRFNRMWRLALETEGVVGDLVVRADLGWSPRQIFYDSTLRARGRPTSSGALGAEWTSGSEWLVSAAAIGMAVFEAPSDATLLGLESDDADATARDMAVLYGAGGTVRRSFEEQHLTLEASGLYSIRPGMYVARAQVSWSELEPHVLSVGGVLIGGDAGTLGSDYEDSDFAYVAYEATW
jgi:hypothetical protein